MPYRSNSNTKTWKNRAPTSAARIAARTKFSAVSSERFGMRSCRAAFLSDRYTKSMPSM